jgi:alpha-D-ribose 1-methylphosphonate 5-triphosphate diphosphatase
VHETAASVGRADHRTGRDVLGHPGPARFEVTDASAVPWLEAFLKERKIHLFSFMDHTPGQGQFREEEAFENYYGRVYGKKTGEIREIIENKFRSRETAAGRFDRLAALCRSMGIPMASHDDDSREKVLWLRERSVGISEFPVNMEALQAAGDAGLRICLGAPNVLRGSSQAGNLSARQAIEKGYGDILCSDYAPWPCSTPYSPWRRWACGPFTRR